MTKHLMAALFLLLALTTCQAVCAQVKRPPKSIQGGVLNGKAVSLPKPVYPDDARSANISGTVKMQVLIDETGKVVSAKAITGPESASLRSAAEAAAMQATFEPTRLAGRPVKVSGTIDYNFVLRSQGIDEFKPLALSTMLTVFKAFASDVDKLKPGLKGDDNLSDLLEDAAHDLTQYKEELASLYSLSSMAPAKRVEAIDAALSSMRARSNSADQWQLDMGGRLGDIFGPLVLRMIKEGDDFDLYNVDWNDVGLKLDKVRELTASAPPGFPPDLLEKIKIFHGGSAKIDLSRGENRARFISDMMTLIDTISPRSGK